MVLPKPFGASLIGRDAATLILGDNICHGPALSTLLRRVAARTEGATAFGYYVRDPERYGVVSFDAVRIWNVAH